MRCVLACHKKKQSPSSIILTLPVGVKCAHLGNIWMALGPREVVAEYTVGVSCDLLIVLSRNMARFDSLARLGIFMWDIQRATQIFLCKT